MGLTRDQIEAMTSEEVNRYLAEKVMGWTGWPIMLRSEWTPASSLDDAMEAAGKVGLIQDADNDDWYLTLHYRGGDPGIWRCGWAGSTWDDEEPTMLHSWEAPTPALAVCRAVIAAHEASNGNGE